MSLTSLAAIPDLSERILCYYINSTSELQRARVLNVPNWKFECVVFPKQRLLFEAIPTALLEIYACSTLGETLLDQISCSRLEVCENSNFKLADCSPVSEHPAHTELVKE